MKNAAIFFFSGTGNTWFVARKISIMLTDKGIKSKVYSIDALEKDEADKIISENDLIIFGYPIYASYMPIPMVNFANMLQSVENKETAIFCTQMMFSGDGAKVLDDILSKKGFLTKWSEHFNMPNNLNSGIFDFLPITNDSKKLKKAIRKTNKDVFIFTEQIMNSETYLKGFSKFSMLIAKLQRPVSKPKNNIWKNFLKIDNDLCIKCGKCFKVCPVNNIKKIDNNFVTDGNCCACLRCHNFCPTNAIIAQGKPNTRVHYHGIVKDFDPIILRKYRH